MPSTAVDPARAETSNRNGKPGWEWQRRLGIWLKIQVKTKVCIPLIFYFRINLDYN